MVGKKKKLLSIRGSFNPSLVIIYVHEAILQEKKNPYTQNI